MKYKNNICINGGAHYGRSLNENENIWSYLRNPVSIPIHMFNGPHITPRVYQTCRKAPGTVHNV